MPSVLVFLLSAAVAAQTPANWLGGSANWTAAASWSGGIVPNNNVPPGSTYAATIGAAGTYTVTLSSPISVSNLTMNNASATLLVSNSTLSVVNSTSLTAGIIQLSSGTIMGGSISTSGSAHIQADTSQGNFLDGVSLAVGVLDMSPSNSQLRLTGGTNFTGSGTIAIGAGSALNMFETAAIPSGVSFGLASSGRFGVEGGFTATLGAATPTTPTVTVNAGASARLDAGTFTNVANTVLVNQGQISFAGPGSTLTISTGGVGSRFDNQGTITVTGPSNTLNLNGAFTNSGTFAVGAGGILNLNSAFTTANLGSFTNSGGIINVTNTLTNTGATLALSSATGSITLSGGGTITGGTITGTGSGHLLADSSFNNALNAVSLGVGVLDLTPSSVSRLRLTGGSNFTGTGEVALGQNSVLALYQTATIPSGVSFGLAGASALVAEGGFTATLGAATTSTPTVSVNSGVSATIGAGVFSSAANTVLVNQGQIQFAGANGTLNIQSVGTGSNVQNAGDIAANALNTTVNISGNATTFTNSGTLSATNGGTIAIAAAPTSFTNFNAGTLTGGTYQAFASSVINFNGRVITTLGLGTAVLLDTPSAVFTAANTIANNDGSFTISNGRQHTVPTFTNAGTLAVGTAQGDLAALNSNVQVNSGGILKGTGTIAGSVSLASGSTLAPGASPGILTVGGVITMAAGSTFSVALNGNVAGTSGYSQLNVTGGAAVNLNNATLATTVGYAPLVTDTFTIINGGAINGTFNGLPNNALVILGNFNGNQYKATIVYSANMVQLVSPVPEPGMILGLCAVVAGAGSVWRRRQRNGLGETVPTKCK